MGKTEPIKSIEDINRIKQFFLDNNRKRDYTLFTLGINTALRISDLLKLKWGQVYDFNQQKFYKHIRIEEQKTKKKTIILLNENAYIALKILKASMVSARPEEFIFKSKIGINRPIHRSRAYSIIKEAAIAQQVEGIISCHSMRKTFGYHAWKKGVPPALIMDIYNHSSLEITKRYLSISQEDKDSVYHKLLL